MNIRPKRWFRVASLVVVAFTIVSAGALLFMLHTERGLRWTADAVESLVSDEIPGHMEIGRLTRVGTPTIVEDLRFFHPSGKEVLHVRHAEIEFEPLDALRGKLTFRRALARGGRLMLTVDPDGRPSIEAALDHPSYGPETDPEGGLHYAMRDIAVDGLQLVFRFAPDETYRVNDVHGVVTIRRELTEGIRLELRGIRGRVTPAVAGFDLRLRRVDGWVHGKERHVLQLNAEVGLGDGRMAARVGLFDRKKKPVRVELEPIEGVQSTIMALLVYAQGAFSSDLDIELRDS